MKKVLFVSYYWPPSGKNTLHWPLFVIRHLPEFGWQPVVLTVEKDSFSFSDESLRAYVAPDVRVFRTKAHDPFSLYRKFIKKSPEDPLIVSEMFSGVNTNWRHRFALWLRLNLFIPDARVGWYFSALRGGSRLIPEEKPDVIVTIGPPHSTHLIGKTLSKKFDIPHVPVCIDPWVDIPYYRGHKRSRLAIALDTHFEREVMEHASRVVFVTKGTREAYVRKYPAIAQKSYVLYWGYAEELFANVKKRSMDTGEEVILHAGNLYEYQNPEGFWKNIKQEIDRGKKLRLRFVGTVSTAIKKSVEEAGLLPYTTYVGFIQLGRVLDEMVNADYLMFCATEKRHLPGKLFEYLRAGNKIIGFADDNDEIAEILKMTNAGKLFPYTYPKLDIFNQLKSVIPDRNAIAQYSRKSISLGLASILNDLIGSRSS
jgi:glycosyltransferase involved in cell wall biosynthesis